MRRQEIITGLIQRCVLLAALGASFFSLLGGAFAQAPQLTKQFGATIIPVHGDTSGNAAIWFMSGTSIASTAGIGKIPTIWTVQSVNSD